MSTIITTPFPLDKNGNEVPMYDLDATYTLGGHRSTNSIKVILRKIDRLEQTMTFEYYLSGLTETVGWQEWMTCVLPDYGRLNAANGI